MVQHDKIIGETPLAFTGEASHYAGKLPLTSTGDFLLVVLAMDPTNANFGMAQKTIHVSP
ncbi:MAG: hypothetical protein ACE5HO_21845 [bacterium]